MASETFSRWEDVVLSDQDIEDLQWAPHQHAFDYESIFGYSDPAFLPLNDFNEKIKKAVLEGYQRHPTQIDLSSIQISLDVSTGYSCDDYDLAVVIKVLLRRSEDEMKKEKFKRIRAREANRKKRQQEKLALEEREREEFRRLSKKFGEESHG